MRAGSLSEPRVVALLSKHFVNARIPELSTEGLIRDRRDVALLRALHAQSLARGGAGFFGGEREAFLASDGTLLETVMSLGSLSADNQHSCASRERPDRAVERFFAAARRSLERLTGAVPEDFEALRSGTSPDVEAARRAVARAEVTAGKLVLRVMVRNDRLMYEGLCGQELWAVPDALVERLDPRRTGTSGELEWPRELFLELAHRSYPRGHVAPRLYPESIRGNLVQRVVETRDGTIRGTLSGEIELAPTRREELGARVEARTGFRCRARLAGDYCFDVRSGSFTSLRLASVESELAHDDRFDMYGTESYRLGVELVRP